MPDCIDPAVNAVKAICAGEAPDGAPGETESNQLPVRDHPVLQICQAGQLAMGSHFFPHSGTKCPRTPGSPPGNICSSA
jgi:hypothetical protein